MTMTWMLFITVLVSLCFGCILSQESVTDDNNNETVSNNEIIVTTPALNPVTNHVTGNVSDSTNIIIPGKDTVSRGDNLDITTGSPEQKVPTTDNFVDNDSSITVRTNKTDTQTQKEVTTSSNNVNKSDTVGDESGITSLPVSTPNLNWMKIFLTDHHFDGRYSYNDIEYLFSFVTRRTHPLDYKTLVTTLYDQDGAVMDFNGTSTDGHIIVFTLARIYTPGTRFPLNLPLQITGSFKNTDEPYFVGNFTKPVNSSFSWIKMNRGLGSIETGETTGTRTAIIIIIPTTVAFLSICGTTAIICWASKKGYLRGRHKSYRLFTDAQVSYESEAETIHI